MEYDFGTALTRFTMRQARRVSHMNYKGWVEGLELHCLGSGQWFAESGSSCLNFGVNYMS